MADFTNFTTIRNPEATIAAIEQYADSYGISYDELEAQRSAANSREWGPRACRALGVRGGSVDALRSALGYHMVELCRSAVALGAILSSKTTGVSMDRIDARVNHRVLEVAV